MPEAKVIKAHTVDNLNLELAKLCKKGWRPEGGVAVDTKRARGGRSPHAREVTLYLQTVVRDDEA